MNTKLKSISFKMTPKLCNPDDNDHASISITTIKTMLLSKDSNGSQKLCALNKLARMFKVGSSEPASSRKRLASIADHVVDSPILPAVIELLKCKTIQMISAAAMVVAKLLTATDNVERIVELGAVAGMVDMIYSDIIEARTCGIKILYIILSDRPHLRKHALNKKLMDEMFRIVKSPIHADLALNVIEIGCQEPEYWITAIPELICLSKKEDHGVQRKVIVMMSKLCRNKGCAQIIVENGGLSLLVDMAGHDNGEIALHAITSLSSLATGSDERIQAIFKSGIMVKVPILLDHHKKNIRKETCNALFKFIDGSLERIGCIMFTDTTMEKVIHLLNSDPCWLVRMECLKIVWKMIETGHRYLIMSLVDRGSIEAICSVVVCSDEDMTMMALNALESILKLGIAEISDYATRVFECEGTAKLELLQEHKSENVYRKAKNLITKYFSESAENDGNDIYERFQNLDL